METKYNPHEVCNNQLVQLTKTINMFQELYNACREDSEKLRKENRELRAALQELHDYEMQFAPDTLPMQRARAAIAKAKGD